MKKYNMTKEDNIFFAKRKIIDNIYKSANLEGIKVTLSDVVEFFNNLNTGKISVDNMLKLKGLKDAWDFVLNTIDEELTKFKKIIPSLTESMYIEEIKNSNTIGNVDKSLIYIHENNINEALKIIDKTDGNGRFGVGGKTYKELVREYINKLQSGRKINNKDNTYVEYLNTVVTNLSKTNEDKKRQKTHDIFVSIMIFVPIIISPILIGFNQTLIGILLMIICWGLLFIIGTNRRKNITKGFYKIKDAHTKFNIINVDNENTIKELYEDSALTFMAETSDRLLDFIYNWLNNENVLKSDSLNLYVFDGKLLKSVYDFCKVSNDIKFISIFNKDLDINEAKVLCQVVLVTSKTSDK